MIVPPEYDFSSPLRKPTIDTAKEVVRYDPYFKLSLPRLTTETDKRSLTQIISDISAGRDLGPYYRKGINEVDPPDTLLQTLGVMHLHIGGKNSNNLLYLQQFSEHVLLLRVSGHGVMPHGIGLELKGIKLFQAKLNAKYEAGSI